jgi:TUP1-like enhancer of split
LFQGCAQLISLSDKNVFCSYGSGEIHVYDFDPDNKIIKTKTVLHMKSTPVMLECNNDLVLSVSDKGIVYVWNIEQDTGLGSSSSKIEIRAERGKKKGHVMIISAKISEIEDENEIVSVLVAYSTKNGLKFQCVELRDWGKELIICRDGKVNETGMEIFFVSSF